MEMKNKLYHHHKSKFSFVIRNFSIGFFGFAFLLSAVTIPTYFSVREQTRYEIQAVSETNEEETPDIEETETEEDQEENHN